MIRPNEKRIILPFMVAFARCVVVSRHRGKLPACLNTLSRVECGRPFPSDDTARVLVLHTVFGPLLSCRPRDFFPFLPVVGRNAASLFLCAHSFVCMVMHRIFHGSGHRIGIFPEHYSSYSLDRPSRECSVAFSLRMVEAYSKLHSLCLVAVGSFARLAFWCGISHPIARFSPQRLRYFSVFLSGSGVFFSFWPIIPLYRYEQRPCFPSLLATLGPLVPFGHCGKLSAFLFSGYTPLAHISRTCLHLPEFSGMVRQRFYGSLVHNLAWYFHRLLPLVATEQTSLSERACSSIFSAVYRVFHARHVVALDGRRKMLARGFRRSRAYFVIFPLPRMAAYRKSRLESMAGDRSAGLLAVRHRTYPGAFLPDIPFLILPYAHEKRYPVPSRLASTSRAVDCGHRDNLPPHLYNLWNYKLVLVWCDTNNCVGASLFLSWNADVGYQYVYQCVLRRCTYHFYGVLPLVVSDSASVLLRACSVCRAVLYRFFHVCSAIAFRCCGDGSLPGDSIRNHGAPRALGPLPVVVADQNHSPLHLATSGPAGLFAFRHRLYAAAFRLAFSRGRLVSRRPRLPRLPAPSFLSSLFPPTASLSRLRGLSPCPPAFVFGGAA